MNLQRLRMLFHKIHFTLIVDGCKRAEYLRKKDLLAYMGKNCMFQSRNFPMDPKLVKIHDNVTIAANVTLCTHDAIRHVLAKIDSVDYMPHLGAIEIDENVFIGIGSIIMPNVYIGKNSIIAAGSLVTKDVPSGVIVAGNPAKIIGSFNELHEKRKAEALELSGKTTEKLIHISWMRMTNRANKNHN